MNALLSTLLVILLSACLLVCCANSALAADQGGVYSLVPDEFGMVLKTPQGQTVFRYMNKRPQDTPLTANSVCCLFPVKTPAGEDVVEFAPTDHPHHRGVFLAWPAAAWYGYTIALDSGRTIGAAVVDHPGNPPSTWHNLQPIAMINPCIVAPGPVTLKAGQPLRLRYRLITHDGPAPVELQKKLADEFRSGGH